MNEKNILKIAEAFISDFIRLGTSSSELSSYHRSEKYSKDYHKNTYHENDLKI